MSEQNTGKIVSYTYDPDNPPRLTAEQRQRLDAMREEDIDCSDIPPQVGLNTWSRPGLKDVGTVDLRRAALREGVLFLDDSIAEFFNASGDDAQAKMNAVLREYIETHSKSA